MRNRNDWDFLDTPRVLTSLKRCKIKSRITPLNEAIYIYNGIALITIEVHGHVKCIELSEANSMIKAYIIDRWQMANGIHKC